MRDDRHHPTTDREISPLLGAVPVEGPPAVLLALPWLLLVLLLAGPFALLLTIAVAMVAAAAMLAAVAAIVASPVLLVRHLRAGRARRAEPRPVTAPAPTSVTVPGF
jgi:hypothetical protein